MDEKKSGKASTSANNLLSRRGCATPKNKIHPRRGVDKRWRKEKRGARLFRRGKNPTTWSPFRRPLREYLVRTDTHTYVYVHTHTYIYIYIYIYPRVHTFLPACSRVQIGIEKSRSQLKLDAQRIRRDKIPIISCPRRRPPPFPRSLLSLHGRRRGGGEGGGGGGGGGGERRGERGGSFPCKNSIPLGIEVSRTRMGIYITHSHLAYLPNKGFSRPPLSLSGFFYSCGTPHSTKRAREVSAKQSLGMTMLIPRMNAS